MKVDMDHDSHLTVKELMEQEKATTAEDQLAMFGAMSAKVCIVSDLLFRFTSIRLFRQRLPRK